MNSRRADRSDRGPREIWWRPGNSKNGQEEAFVQDLDGYLLTLAERIVRRAALNFAFGRLRIGTELLNRASLAKLGLFAATLGG
jgi:hypothetical protein